MMGVKKMPHLNPLCSRWEGRIMRRGEGPGQRTQSDPISPEIKVDDPAHDKARDITSSPFRSMSSLSAVPRKKTEALP